MVLIDFKESLPVDIEIRFNNLVIELGDGAKQVFVHWDQPLLKFSLAKQIPGCSDDYRDYLISAFEDLKGNTGIFRYEDLSDRAVTASIYTGGYKDRSWGVGVKNSDGSKYQLYKVYELEKVVSYRPITRPVNNTGFKLFNSGTLITSGYTVDWETGVITFSPAQPNLNLTWAGNFDVPCRFSLDSVSLVQELKKTECHNGYYSLPSFEILEVRESAIALPTPPILPEVIDHDFALNLASKQKEDVLVSSSFTLFDSGFEVGSLFSPAESGKAKLYRRFLTGENIVSTKDLHYLLCWWRATRGGAIVFDYEGTKVQAREFLNYSVTLDPHSNIKCPPPQYKINSIALSEPGKSYSPFKIPPYPYTLQTLEVDPSNPLDPTITSSNPGWTFPGKPGASPYRVSIFTVATGFNTFPPGGNLNDQWRAARMFWQGDRLWLIAVNNTSSSTTWYGRGALFSLASNGKFDYVDSNLKNYYFSTGFSAFSVESGAEVYKTLTGTSLFIYGADNSVVFGNGSGNGSSRGLLRFEITNQGTELISFLPNTILGPFFSTTSIFQRVIGIFDNNKAFVNVTNHLTLNKFIGNINGIDYIAGSFQEPSGTVGYPVGRNNYGAGSLYPTLLSFKNNLYYQPGPNTKMFYRDALRVDTYYVASGTTPTLGFNAFNLKQNHENSILTRLLIDFRCQNQLTTCSPSQSTNRLLVYFQDNFTVPPRLLDDISRVGLDNSKATGAWMNSLAHHDRFGNSLGKFSSIRVAYYHSGSGAAINLTRQISPNTTPTASDCNTPYGFGVFVTGFVTGAASIFSADVNPRVVFFYSLNL